MLHTNKGASLKDRLKDKTSKLSEKSVEIRGLKKNNKDLEHKFKRWVRLHEGHNIAKAFQKSKVCGKSKPHRTLNQT